MTPSSDSFELPAAGPDDDARYMTRALALAEEAAAKGETPVGCVIVHEGQVVAEAYNLRETLHDPTAHAEVLALKAASRALGRWRLSGCTLYVTLEPCFMCAGAIVLGRLPRVVYGATDPKAGASGSLANVLQDPRLNHRCDVVAGVEAKRASAQLKAFFGNKRRSAGRGAGLEQGAPTSSAPEPQE